MRAFFRSRYQRRLLRFILGVFVASRLWVALFVYLGHLQRPYLAPVSGGWIGVKNWWLNPWTTYDSIYFIEIATSGYRVKTSAFFPLYPYLLKLAGSNPIAIAAWGIFLSNLTCAVGLYYLYRLTRIDFNAKIARICVILVAFFPMTMFFSAVYTDSLFFLLIVATMYCIRKGHWNWVVLWSVLAALTRNPGPLIALMLFLEHRSYQRKGVALSRYTSLAFLAPLGAFVSFQSYIALRFGGLAGFQAQAEFSRHLSWPWTPIYLDLTHLSPRGWINPVVLLHVVVAILVFVFIWRYWKIIPKSYSAFVLGVNLMNLCYSWNGLPHTVSGVRYQMSAFPFSQMLANGIETIWRRRLGRVLFMMIYLFFGSVMCWAFGQKIFIG